jgi:hypothetical protein
VINAAVKGYFLNQDLALYLSVVQRFIARFRTIGELFRMFGRGGRWWLLPMVMVLMLFGILLVLASATPLGPFIYALF